MRTNKFIGLMLSAILGGLIGAFAIVKLFPKNEMVNTYQSNQPVRYVSYSGSGQAPVDFTFAAEQTVHAVVHVRTKSKVENGFRNPIYEFLYGNGNSASFQPVVGFGSGVIITTDGYIVTNYHVIKNADEINIKLNDNREFDARLIGFDPSSDIALLKVDANNLPFIPFGSSEELRLGEWVLAIGNPFNLTSTVTAGIVSAKGRNLNLLNDKYKIESFIQTDAALNPGNSGGALVNTRGELVGINTAIISPSGSYAGNSFAVPVTIVKKVVDDLREFGTVQRAILGVSITDVNAEIAKQNDLDKISGVYINEVKSDGSAKEAGIDVGDIVVNINGVEVNNSAELQEQISKYRPNDKIKVTVFRKGKTKQLDVILKNVNGDTKIVKSKDAYSIYGATFSEINAEDKQKLGIRYGVQITELGEGKFNRAGIEKGFIITRMNNKPVNNIEELKKILNNTQGGVYIEGLYSNGVIAYYAFGL